MKRHKKAKITIVALLLLVISIQFVQRPVSDTVAAHPIKAPAEVTDILRRACYDCHSNETRLSWYDKVAPASWLITRHVNEGRSRFNFSTWDTLSKTDQNALLWEMLNMVLSKKMPLPDYAAFHPNAALTPQDIETLKKYVTDLSPARYHDTVEIKRAQEQSDRSRQTAGQPVAANGVRYIPDYQNWQVISTTNRFDNHSIRILYANDICAKAIRENRINPLPEGSTIVKVVWNSIEEENGDIKPGSLNNIQIMTKDSKKFQDSKGWGFAKFNGTELKPYGKTATFNQTCFNCHKIAQATDYAFSLPLQNKDLK